MAPLDKNGNPIQLHHRDQNPDGPIDEITQQQHQKIKNRKPSDVKHDKEWRRWRSRYWEREWDEGRFKDLPRWNPPPSPQLQLPGLEFDPVPTPEQAAAGATVGAAAITVYLIIRTAGRVIFPVTNLIPAP